MHLTTVIATGLQVGGVLGYASWANKPGAKVNRAHDAVRRELLEARQGAGAAGSSTLIGDLATVGATTPVGSAIEAILQGTGNPQDTTVGTAPASSISGCSQSTDTCCVWYFVSQTLTSAFLDSDGLCTDLARGAIRLGFHDAATWSVALAAKGEDFGGADGSFVLFDEITRIENAGLENITTYTQQLLTQFPMVGAADLIQFMANHATVTCPLGPRVRTFVGRVVSVLLFPTLSCADGSACACVCRMLSSRRRGTCCPMSALTPTR